VALAPVVVLNGTPRSGKSTIAAALADRLDGSWMQVGVDLMWSATPERFLPGIGLRPGAERPDLESFVVASFEALYAAVRSLSVAGVGVAVDVGHHDDYSRPLGILGRGARQLRGCPVLFVGVRCPPEVVMARRVATWSDEPTDESWMRVQRWEAAVHRPGIYDLEVDTSIQSVEASVHAIESRLAQGPGTAFAEAAGATERRGT
jgi:chloramphenicol 3-O phosphotransferase